jgi:hypothetical protein
MEFLQLVDPSFLPNSLSSYNLIQLFIILRCLCEETGEYKILLDTLLPLLCRRPLVSSSNDKNMEPMSAFSSPLLLQTVATAEWHLSSSTVASYGKDLIDLLERCEKNLSGDISLVYTRLLKKMRFIGEGVWIEFLNMF